MFSATGIGALYTRLFFWTFSRNKFQQKVGDILSFLKISLSFLKKSLSFLKKSLSFFSKSLRLFGEFLSFFSCSLRYFQAPKRVIQNIAPRCKPTSFKFQIPNLTWKDLTNLSLFVFSINGLKQNARSLLTPFFDTDFYPLLHGSLHYVLHGSSNNHIFQRFWLAVEDFQPIRRWLKKLPWRAKPRLPCERA